MQKFTKYYKAISYLEGLVNLPQKGDYMIKNRNLGVYLKRMRYFLSLIGNPHLSSEIYNPKYIHITGTSGKGSVTNMLHEVLQASGMKVGSFTSPFVTTTIEKIRVGDLYISPHEFADILEEIKPQIDFAYVNGPYGRPSYFEIILAIGFIYFKRMGCEYVILEVGCGGRYDATNVIEKPVATAITNIDYDHREILGNTLQEIAHEKAGIVKPGSNFFTTETRPALLKLFKEACKRSKATMTAIPLQESYRQANTLLVSTIAESLGISHKYIEKGIQKSFLPCRFETIQDRPRVVIDGAHNRSKMQSVVENLRHITYKKLILIIGMADSKEHESILRTIVPLAHQLYFTRFQTKERKCAHPKKLAKIAEKYHEKNVEVKIYLDSNSALKEALDHAQRDEVILITGSFFLAGELRKIWMSEESILTKRTSSQTVK